MTNALNRSRDNAPSSSREPQNRRNIFGLIAVYSMTSAGLICALISNDTLADPSPIIVGTIQTAVAVGVNALTAHFLLSGDNTLQRGDGFDSLHQE